jgi:hypothetical protein
MIGNPYILRRISDFISDYQSNFYPHIQLTIQLLYLRSVLEQSTLVNHLGKAQKTLKLTLCVINWKNPNSEVIS